MGVNAFRAWHLVVAIAALVGAGGAGAALALTGATSRPERAVGFIADTVSVKVFECIDGPEVAPFAAGDRVLIVARSGDSAWLGVRKPGATAQTVWLPSDVLTLDPGDELNPALPIAGDCPSAVVVVHDAALAPVSLPPAEQTADVTRPHLGTPIVGSCVWTYEFNPSDSGPEGVGAHDAPGNVNSEAVASVSVTCFG